MGACTSCHSESGSAMKLGVSFGSKPEKLPSIPPSPVKLKPTTNVGRPINGQCSPAPYALICIVKDHMEFQFSGSWKDYHTPLKGSKEEAFFDSKPWLDSDCEDDFYSVNGDFTPSRGNTPVHHNFSRANKNPMESRSPVSLPAPSPIVQKKKLADLFRESFRDGNDIDGAADASGDQIMTNGKIVVKPKSVNGTPYVSGSKRTSNEDLTEDRRLTSTQCCLPTFASLRSSSQRRKMSPTIAVGDKA